MPKKQIGKKIDVNGNQEDLGYTLNDEEVAKIKEIDSKVSKSTTINNKPLNSNINLNATDVGALSSDTPVITYGETISPNADEYNVSLISVLLDNEGNEKGALVLSADASIETMGLSGTYMKLVNASTGESLQITSEAKIIVDENEIKLPKSKSGTIATTNDIPDTSSFIDKNVNNLTNYTLTVDEASKIQLSMDNSTYVLTVKMLNSKNEELSSSAVDFPLESMVVNATYDATNKKIVLTLKNGTTTSFSVADLVSGLATQSALNTTNTNVTNLTTRVGTNETNIAKKLDKVTYEYNRELAIGSTGKVLVGKFPMYDSNVTINVSSTTNTTYNGTLVIASQNINDSHGGSYVANVYGDPSGTLSSAFVIKYPTNSRVFEVYCNFPSWSKNLIHVKAVALSSAPSNIVELVTSIPTDSLVTVNNVLKSVIDSKVSPSDLGNLAFKDSLTSSDVGALPSNTTYVSSVYYDSANNTLTVNQANGSNVTHSLSNGAYKISSDAIIQIRPSNLSNGVHVIENNIERRFYYSNSDYLSIYGGIVLIERTDTIGIWTLLTGYSNQKIYSGTFSFTSGENGDLTTLTLANIPQMETNFSQTGKVYINASNNGNSSFKNNIYQNTNCFMQDGKLYSEGKEVAIIDDIPTNYVTIDTTQTITGNKTFSGKGLTVSGRTLNAGDDEGIVVNRASNGYAGLCLGTPSGERSVIYLLPTTTSGTRAVWRYNNGSTSYNAYHPAKEGTIALTSDIPTVNNGTLTIQQNGTTLGTFSANQSGNTTINLSIPNFVTLTQAEYDALATKDANTYYFIKEE